VTTSIINDLYTDDLELTVDQQGKGRPVLLLHGGGGPPSMGALPSALSDDFEVIAPVHPGFAGTPRPEWFIGIDDIALTYLQLLEQRDLSDVLVVGSSIGGWIASEMAVREHERITATIAVYAREPYMHDPKLRRRLALVPTPVAAI
jgi:pimeloyl-ACP methyl ester carboxylesterase